MLNKKVKKSLNVRKRDDSTRDSYPSNKKLQFQGEDREILEFINQQRFGLPEYEMEEYSQDCQNIFKNMFEVKELECPILWVRVDPQFEHIRQI